MRITVVILAFNEECSLEKVVREINFVLQTLGQTYEIVIIDDGSTDNTGVIADELARAYEQVQVIHHPTNKGLGGVYRTGFSQAHGDYITFFPADGQFPAAIIARFVPLMEDADMVLGYVPNRPCSLVTKLLSEAERFLYRLLFGHFPKFQGILMFKKSLLGELHLKSTGRGWVILMELIIRVSRAGYRTVSVPTEMRPRMDGISKVRNISTIWANLKQMVALVRYL